MAAVGGGGPRGPLPCRRLVLGGGGQGSPSGGANRDEGAVGARHRAAPPDLRQHGRRSGPLPRLCDRGPRRSPRRRGLPGGRRVGHGGRVGRWCHVPRRRHPVPGPAVLRSARRGGHLDAAAHPVLPDGTDPRAVVGDQGGRPDMDQQPVAARTGVGVPRHQFRCHRPAAVIRSRPERCARGLARRPRHAHHHRDRRHAGRRRGGRVHRQPPSWRRALSPPAAPGARS